MTAKPPSALNGPTQDANPAHIRRPWYSPGLNFSCTQCGNCCTGAAGVVYITEEEGQKMADHLGIDAASFFQLYAEHRYGKWTLKERLHPDRGYDCVFLDFDKATGKARCRVHAARPTQCWSWPFWPSNLKSERAWNKAAKNCPGMRKGGHARQREKNAGQFYPVEQIRVILEKNPPGL